MSTVRVRCPNPGCQASFSLPPGAAPRSRQCPRCGSALEGAGEWEGAGGGPHRDDVTPPTSGPWGGGYSPLDLPTGTVFAGRYRIEARLGAGGMGAVYRAFDQELERDVALKVPLVSLEEEDEFRKRFVREARVAAKLQHPNLCPVHDVGTYQGQPYLTMAFIDGQSLGELLKARARPIEPMKAARLVSTLAKALQKAHDLGIVHRDLKPGNVMISKEGRAVVMDFGLARRNEGEDSLRTRTGQMMGTPAYMPLEQFRGDLKAIGPRTDVYSLGVMLYQVLTGRVPYSGNLTAIYDQLARPGLAPSASAAQPDVDEGLAAICRKAMAKEVGERYESMAAFAAALDGWAGASSVERRAVSAGPGPAMEAAPAQPAAQAPAAQAAPRSAPRMERSGRPPVAGIAAALAALVPLLGIIIYVTTNKGTVKITGSDPKMEVRIDGDVITIEKLGGPITLNVGEHELLVTRDDGRFRTEAFQILRGKETLLDVTYTPRSAEVGGPGPGPEPPAPKPSPIEPGKIGPGPETPRVAGADTRAQAGPNELVSSFTGMKLMRIEPGTFTMGSNDGYDNEEPTHSVTISQPFYLGKYELTQAEYEKVMGRNPSHFRDKPNHPVEQITWFEAVAFCNALSEREGLTPYYRIKGKAVMISGGDGYRLPTEAEWEYACRAGSTTRYNFGDDPARLEDHAWFGEEFESGSTHPVGRKGPNAWGLFDMHGNVWEWCWDWYDEAYYKRMINKGPTGPETGTDRVLRGGSWNDNAALARSSHRYANGLGDAGRRIGVRLARNAEGASAVVASAEEAKPAEPIKGAVAPPVPSLAPNELVSSFTGMKLMRIEPGTFTMGSNDPGGDEAPAHSVTISQPFYLGKYELTQAEYEKVMGRNPSHFRDKPNHPVEQITWFEAVAFCNALSEREGLTPYYRIKGKAVMISGGDGYRLPTEAEWEYACRAGSTTRYSFGDNPSRLLMNHGWFVGNADNMTHRVGVKEPNAWGLFDMHGNVWEWCWDWYDEAYYKRMINKGPTGPETGKSRVLRGGSWVNIETVVRSSYRARVDPGNRDGYGGARIARNAEGPPDDGAKAARGTTTTP